MATDDEIREKVMADGLNFGVGAAADELTEGIPAGVASYMLGFLNGLLLAQHAPAVAAEVTHVFSGDVMARGTAVQQGRVNANQQRWIEGWRETVG